jgi:colanic acid/amylovoran biosynthesis protein
MNILLINNHSIENAGDYAILLETLRVLEQSFPGARVALSFNEPEAARAALPGYRIYRAPLAWSLRLDGRRAFHLLPRWRRLLLMAALILGALLYRLGGRWPAWLPGREQGELLGAYAESDLVLACGGGYIYAPGPNQGVAGVFTQTILGCLLALLMGKPLVLLPQSIGPLHDDLQRRLTRWLVRGARLTFVREGESLRLLERLGCAERALLAPDMAFGMASGSAQAAARLLEPLLPPEHGPLVGMTALNWSGQNYTFGGQADYEQALLGCVDALTARGATVVIFTQCAGPSDSEDDRVVSARLHAQAARPDQVVHIDRPLPPDLLQAAYGRMDYFIGTRMHSVILALNAGVPALAVGYLHKTRGVLGDLGLAERCLDITGVSADELVAAFECLRAAPAQPAVAPFLDRALRFKRALPALLQAAVRAHG